MDISDISFDFQVGLQRLGLQPLMVFFWGWLITTVFQNDLNLPLGEDRCGYFMVYLDLSSLEIEVDLSGPGVDFNTHHLRSIRNIEI